MESAGNSSISGTRKSSHASAPSSAAPKPNGKSAVDSIVVENSNEKTAVSSSKPTSSTPTTPNPTAALSSVRADQLMFFRDVTIGPHEAELVFHLVHFWEARNPNTKLLIGQEMLLIDEQGTAIQGFVPASRVGTFDLTSGSVYKLTNFFGSRNKDQNQVADHVSIVSFSWNSGLSLLDNPLIRIPADRFRFHSYEEFSANCDSRGDLYDFIGHMRLVNGHTITDHAVLDEVEIAEKRHLCVHVQTHDGPVLKLYLWDNAAYDFCKKFKSYASIPRVILVTTVNPKHLGGTLALTSMSSTRVFMEDDVPPIKEYLEWLGSNSAVADKVVAEVVSKPESITLGELFAYIKQEASKVAWFECTATIDDVFKGLAWYYISCGGCNSKAVKGPNSLICNNKKCGKSQVTGVAQYLTKISVYDKSEQAVFVLLGDAGKELTGKHAAELVSNYFESNGGAAADHCVPVPQALLDTIGQTHKFIVKISGHNLEGKTRTITVTKVLPREDTLPAAFRCFGSPVGVRARKADGTRESDEAKRLKCD